MSDYETGLFRWLQKAYVSLIRRNTEYQEALFLISSGEANPKEIARRALETSQPR